MELRTLPLSDLHFPKTEWRWLRQPATYPSHPDKSPDAFLWAAEVDGKLWAWHPRGADVDCKQAGARTRVLVLKTDGTELEAHALYLKTVFSCQPAQDIEWVAALQTLTERLKFNPVDSGIPVHWGAALEACGLSAHLGVLAQRGRFTFLTASEQQLIFDKRWDLSTMELAETLEPALREDFVAAARKWNLSAGHAKECLNFVMMLFKKMGAKTVHGMLTRAFNNAEEFRTALLRTAQPELATLSQKRIEMLRALRVPPRSSVYGDPSFESDLLKITHTPRKMSDFENFKTWISDPELAEKIRELLEIYQ